jgi:hypothetical protein
MPRRLFAVPWNQLNRILGYYYQVQRRRIVSSRAGRVFSTPTATAHDIYIASRYPAAGFIMSLRTEVPCLTVRALRLAGVLTWLIPGMPSLTVTRTRSLGNPTNYWNHAESRPQLKAYCSEPDTWEADQWGVACPVTRSACYKFQSPSYECLMPKHRVIRFGQIAHLL